MKHIQKSLLLERNLAGGLEGGAGSAESAVKPQELLNKEFYDSLTKESQASLSRVLRGSQIQKIKSGEQAVRLNSVLKMGFIPERKAVIEETKVAQQDHRSEVGEPKVITLNDNGGNSYESAEVQGNDVTALQTLVGTAVDGKWGPNSQKALNAYLKKGRNAVKDVQRIIGTTADGVFGRNSKAALAAFVGGSVEDKRFDKNSSLRDQASATADSIDDMKAFLEATSGSKNVDNIYDAIAKGKNFDAQGYSLFNLVQRFMWKNEATKSRNEAAKIYNIINKNKQKFNQGYEALLSNSHKDTREGTLKPSTQRVLTHARKALPWVAGVYVADIPLPYVAKMVPSGVPLNEAQSFISWVQDGMKGDFNPNEKVNTGTDTLQNLKGLRHTLATATSYIEANANKWNLKEVAAKVRELVSTYIIHRLGPDAKMIKQSSQNIFEVIGDGLGINSKAKKLIEKVVAGAEKGELDYNDLFELEQELIREDNDGLFNAGKNAGFIKSFERRNSYMLSTQRQGDVIDAYVESIYAWKKAFNTVQSKERASASIPDTNAKYKKGRVAPGAYGPDLSKVFEGRDMGSITGEEVYKELTSTRPDKKANRDSIGWIMKGIRNLDTDMDARKIPHNVIGEAIKNGKMLPISQVGKVAVNTSIDGKIVSTDVATLLGRGDTHMFHTPIEYTVDGQKLKYNLYMRPDCSNFVMVPEKFDNNVGVGVNWRIPVVIPYNVIFGWSPAPVGNNDSSLPIDDAPRDIIDAVPLPKWF